VEEVSLFNKFFRL